jgi:hypothetical protein
MRLLLWILLFMGACVRAQVIPIEPLEKCFLCSSDPSLTMYWPGQDAKAVIVFIPGGEGYLGLKLGQSEVRGQLLQTLKRLTQPELTRGKLDVVLLDSPGELSPRQPYPSARGATDHMIRIESAVRFYKAKTGLPVWLMGHSNGGISLSEFLKYAQKNGKTELISGFIASGIRDESYFNAPIAFPIFFIHHKADGCYHTRPDASYAHYERVRQITTSLVHFSHVTGGEAQASDPCRSGFHMYNGAGAEVANSIDAFMSKVYP